jgi:hypothetical protein
MEKLIEYETPRASVRGVFLLEGIADTVISPVSGGVDVESWGTDEEITGTDGGNVYLLL